MKTTGWRLNVLRGLVACAFSLGLQDCTSGPAVDTEYQNCVLGDSCTGNTVCETTEFTSGTGTGSSCTSSCTIASDCAPDPNGATVDCVINSGESTGQCYIDCNASASLCEDGTTCSSLDGFLICVP